MAKSKTTNSSGRSRVSPGLVAGIIAVILLAAAIGAYCGLCGWVRGNGCLLPNTVARDVNSTIVVDLSKLTREQAEEALSLHMEDYLDQRDVTVTYLDGQSLVLDGSLLEMDPRFPVNYGMNYKDYQPFLRLGVLWLGIVKDPMTLSLSAATLTEKGEAAAREVAAQIAKEVYLEPVDHTVTLDEAGENVLITLGTDGRELNETALTTTLQQALLSGEREVAVEYKTIPVSPLTAERVNKTYYTAPADPYLLEDGSLSLPVDGVSVDLESAQAILDATAPGESCTIPLVFTAPDFASCMDLLFKDELAHNVSVLDGVANRSFNVNRTAEFCNETILMPGEVFSYLGAVGDPSEENGYKLSTGYKDGETVEMEGGGACQISSALYYCAVYANLEIVTRYNHAFSVGYVPLGLDATVYYPYTDFQFRNNTPYPIKIIAYTDGKANGYATVKIMGTDHDGSYVRTERTVLSTTKWETVYEPDEEIPVGTTKVKTTPYTGYKVEVYRCVYGADGKLISRTFENTSIYAKRDKVILFNPADADKLGLNPDGTPKDAFKLTVNWVDEEGNELAPAEATTLAKDSTYTAEEKTFENYILLRVTGDPSSGTMDKDRTVTFVYREYVVEPDPEPSPEPSPEPDPEPSPEPDPEPSPEPDPDPSASAEPEDGTGDTSDETEGDTSGETEGDTSGETEGDTSGESEGGADTESGDEQPAGGDAVEV